MQLFVTQHVHMCERVDAQPSYYMPGKLKQLSSGSGAWSRTGRTPI